MQMKLYQHLYYGIGRTNRHKMDKYETDKHETSEYKKDKYRTDEYWYLITFGKSCQCHYIDNQ